MLLAVSACIHLGLTGLALSTLGCYLLAVWTGLFGFKEIRTRAGIAAGLIEVAGPGGTVQATYDGHPLYTYVGDGGPRQTRGSNLDINGGRWYEIRVSGTGT